MVRNRELKSDLDHVSHRLEMIETILLVSNPDSPKAADAYNGLSKTVRASLNATKILEASLAQLDLVSRSTDDMEAIRIKLRELMAITGIELVDDHERYREAFDIVGSGSVPSVVKPAYIAKERGTVVARGVIELSDRAAGDMEVEAANLQITEAPGADESSPADLVAESESPSVGSAPLTGEVLAGVPEESEGEQV